MKIENIKKGKGTWSVDVSGVNIKVKNSTAVAKLFIDGKLQDIFWGIFLSPHLFGKLPNGKEVKVVLGGVIKMHCDIFVDNKLDV